MIHMQVRAQHRLDLAVDNLSFAHETHRGFPSDVTQGFVRDALVEFEDALAVAQEWMPDEVAAA